MKLFNFNVLLGSASLLALLLIAALPSAAPASVDRDCPSFASQRAAQIYFLRHGGPSRDPQDLDGNDNGVACEDNPCPCYTQKHLPRLNLDAVLAEQQFTKNSG